MKTERCKQTVGQPIRLVHVTTIPASLFFLTGQPHFMRQFGYETHALSSPGSELDRFLNTEDVASVATVAMERRITPLRDCFAIFQLWRRLRRLRPSLVHAHTPKGGLLGMISAWIAGVPVRIYHIHGLPFMTSRGLRRRLLRWSEAVACRLAHRVLCVSQSIRQVAIEEGLCPPSKIDVLRKGSINGVDTVRFDPVAREPEGWRLRCELGIPADAPVLGYVGRLVREKGIGELVEAWSELSQRFTKAHLIVIGPFEPQDPIGRETRQRLETDPRIHLMGWLSDTPPYFAAMDVLVLPTYREGFPVVPLEAAAMGLPVVATRVPGCVDAVLDGVTGTLVPPGDASVLAKAIANYLEDGQLRRAHGQSGRDRILEDFRREDIWAATAETYAQLLSRASSERAAAISRPP